MSRISKNQKHCIGFFGKMYEYPVDINIKIKRSLASLADWKEAINTYGYGGSSTARKKSG